MLESPGIVGIHMLSGLLAFAIKHLMLDIDRTDNVARIDCYLDDQSLMAARANTGE